VHLLVNIRRIGQRLQNFIAEQLPVALSQAMRGHGVRQRTFAGGEYAPPKK
jgi:hypothetical protein